MSDAPASKPRPRRLADQDADELPPFTIGIPDAIDIVARDEPVVIPVAGEHRTSAVRVTVRDSGRSHPRSGLPPRTRA